MIFCRLLINKIISAGQNNQFNEWQSFKSQDRLENVHLIVICTGLQIHA